MGKVWILDTETKGTGAHIAPYEKAPEPAPRNRELALVELGGPPRREAAPEPTRPSLFKVVDVMSSQVLAEGVGALQTVQVLEEMDSLLDARIFQWMEATRRWRLLTLDECKAFWSFRGRVGSPGSLRET
jgi:hypothetical protein